MDNIAEESVVIPRPKDIQRLEQLIGLFSVTAILGARQCGKTTLAAVEYKFADAPRLTRSMHSASTELDLEHLWVVYPGKARYRLDERITALPLTEVPAVLGTSGS